MEKSLEKNTVNIRSVMKNSSDLNLKYARVGGVDICVLTCDGQTDTSQIARLVYHPLSMIREKNLTPSELSRLIGSELLIAAEEKPVISESDAVSALMSGFCVILIDGTDTGYAIGVQGFETRSVSEPESHQNIRGAREGFVEAIRVNMSLVRRRVKSPRLIFETMKIGKLSSTDACLCYIDGRADKRLVDEVRGRLNEVPLSLVLESGYVQPFLENKGLLFSQTGATERPDVFVSKLYEGRVGIIIDGSPFSIVVPKLFSENFIMLDDYLEKPVFTGMMRLIRYFSFLLCVMLPGFYVALADFHPELIPDALLINLTAALSLTPYDVLTECILLDIFYEIMREAGLRLPANIGHAVSIVGGIVIGDIVVSTGLVGAPTLVIVAISSIAGYVVPDLYPAAAVMRLVFIIAGGVSGIFGITITGIMFAARMCAADAYGVPFTAPVSPFSLKGMRDTFIRVSWRILGKTDMKLNDLEGVRPDER